MTLPWLEVRATRAKDAAEIEGKVSASVHHAHRWSERPKCELQRCDFKLCSHQFAPINSTKIRKLDRAQQGPGCALQVLPPGGTVSPRTLQRISVKGKGLPRGWGVGWEGLEDEGGGEAWSESPVSYLGGQEDSEAIKPGQEQL